MIRVQSIALAPGAPPLLVLVVLLAAKTLEVQAANADSPAVWATRTPHCSDRAAENYDAATHPTTDNEACEYSCAGLAAHFVPRPGMRPGLCLIDRAGTGGWTMVQWPVYAAEQVTIPALAGGRTSVVQGHGGPLPARLDAVGASLIVRYVKMTGLRATPTMTAQNRTSACRFFVNGVMTPGLSQCGAAIYLSQGDAPGMVHLVIERVYFEQNTASMQGGAVYVDGGSRATVSILESVFLRNSVLIKEAGEDSGNDDRMGGAVALHQVARVVILGSNFSGNECSSGGALYVDSADANATIDRCAFSGNGVQTLLADTFVWGGAVHVKSLSLLNVTRCNFTHNFAVSSYMEASGHAKGGGMYAQAVAQAEIAFCHFGSNRATHSGGALHLEYAQGRSAGHFSVSGSHFRHNEGGAVGVAMSRVRRSVFGIDFSSCTFDTNSGGEAGAITARYPQELIIDDCDFRNNVGVSASALFAELDERSLYKAVLSKAHGLNNSDCVASWTMYNDGALSSTRCLRQAELHTQSSVSSGWDYVSIVPETKHCTLANIPGNVDCGIAGSDSCVVSCLTALRVGSSTTAKCDRGVLTWNGQCADGTCEEVGVASPCQHGGRCWAFVDHANGVVQTATRCECGEHFSGNYCQATNARPVAAAKRGWIKVLLVVCIAAALGLAAILARHLHHKHAQRETLDASLIGGSEDDTSSIGGLE